MLVDTINSRTQHSFVAGSQAKTPILKYRVQPPEKKERLIVVVVKADERIKHKHRETKNRRKRSAIKALTYHLKIQALVQQRRIIVLRGVRLYNPHENLKTRNHTSRKFFVWHRFVVRRVPRPTSKGHATKGDTNQNIFEQRSPANGGSRVEKATTVFKTVDRRLL